MTEDLHYSERDIPKESKDFSYMQSDRGELTKELSKTLPEQERIVLREVSNTIIFFDRGVDSKKLPDSTFDSIVQFIEDEDISFNERERIENTLKEIEKLNSRKVRENILRVFKEHFLNSIKNVKRRFKVIDEKEIEELRVGEHPDFTIMLFLLFPEKDFSILERISKKYTLAAKIADDMIDFIDDVKLGFLYIPQKEVGIIKGIKISNSYYEVINEPQLNMDYIKEQISKSKEIFQEGDKIADKLNLPEEFDIFRKLMYSWIDEAEKVCLDKNSHPTL